MKVVSISQGFFDLVEGDRELMLKHNLPCIVVVRLRFRGKRRDFAVPLRSNIAPNVPKDQYFALPPRPTTRPNCRHGIHYIKMFPITRPTSAALGPRARPTMRRSSALSTATPSALSPSVRRTSTATSARGGLALPSTSTRRGAAGGREVGHLGSVSSHAELLRIFERRVCVPNT